MYLPEFLNLGAGFRKYFEAMPAVDDELRRAAFAIRHAVYCVELGYEAVRPDGLEMDAFDDRAVHCLLRSVTTGEFVGCVRLIMARAGGAMDGLPFAHVAGEALDRSVLEAARLDPMKCAEVSRLAVISRYRRRQGERTVAIGLDDSDFGTATRQRFPYIAAGLYLGMIAQARHHGIDTLFMLTERRLAKQLARLGVNLTTIGTPIEHRGVRYPSMMSVPEVIDGLNFFVRPLFAVIASEMETAYRRAGAATAPEVTRAS